MVDSSSEVSMIVVESHLRLSSFLARVRERVR